MIKIRTLFLKVRAFSSNFQEKEVETSPSSPSSFAPVVVRKYRISLFTKFAIVKLKIDLFSVFMIFLGSILRCCLFRRAFFTYSTIIKRMCKTAFPTKFRTTKRKADACSLFLLFISMNH